MLQKEGEKEGEPRRTWHTTQHTAKLYVLEAVYKERVNQSVNKLFVLLLEPFALFQISVHQSMINPITDETGCYRMYCEDFIFFYYTFYKGESTNSSRAQHQRPSSFRAVW